MNVFIRTDSSNAIGFGHVMRCLTLAQSLCKLGAKVYFIVRNDKHDLGNYIEEKGFCVFRHKYNTNNLFFDKETDSRKTINVISDYKCDLLIVDHYMIDIDWHTALRPYTSKIMVIDDLSNRQYDCDFILDQNYSLHTDRYDELIPSHSIKLLGVEFALLRDEFLQYRPDPNTRMVEK